jgi:hypothetical protein
MKIVLAKITEISSQKLLFFSLISMLQIVNVFLQFHILFMLFPDFYKGNTNFNHQMRLTILLFNINKTIIIKYIYIYFIYFTIK